MEPDECEEAYADVAAQVLELLVERGETLAVAESLTGGMVAAEITAAPGSSRAFRGSVTAYATDLKRDLLGVDGALLAERGAVDEDVARRMAEGVQGALSASWGLSTTGVAGPEPQDGRPVGTVFAAVAGPHGATVSRGLKFEGDRGEIREQSVTGALELLRGELAGNVRGKGKEQDGGNGCLQP
ncbi:damage-inducible protein CinA [Streptomyces abyssalis]|uniref:Damage-inducible protein CinA n=1 Tax=Streptomyces abyssalis TaxID=933944 RepID=A0A1E7JIX0_9ACTN|nr:damage-inducible protein CinA [Streptomyces abyssalis]OEU93237.1 damage-inducible protein CinA [Streptomyces abyssalis]OEV30255.1 damage-inducible protein CinA [Streptomyces nanshensis]